jgi:hypothetical protein
MVNMVVSIGSGEEKLDPAIFFSFAFGVSIETYSLGRVVKFGANGT